MVDKRPISAATAAAAETIVGTIANLPVLVEATSITGAAASGIVLGRVLDRSIETAETSEDASKAQTIGTMAAAGAVGGAAVVAATIVTHSDPGLARAALLYATTNASTLITTTAGRLSRKNKGEAPTPPGR